MVEIARTRSFVQSVMCNGLSVVGRAASPFERYDGMIIIKLCITTHSSCI